MPIRLAGPTDAAAIAELHTASWRSAYRGILSDPYLDGPIALERRAVWRERFEHPGPGQYVAVAEDSAVLAGFTCLYQHYDPQWGTLLDNLHVLPERQGKGIGRSLIAKAAHWCAAQMVLNQQEEPVYLWVIESNAPARRFYERLGGAVAGETMWTAPDGTQVPELRYAWSNPGSLLERAQVDNGIQ